MAYADEEVFFWINGLAGANSVLDWIMKGLASDYLIPVTLALALVGLWYIEHDRLIRQKHQIGVFIALTSTGIASLAVFTINAAYFRPRPFVDHPEVAHDVLRLFYQPTDSSFPSNPIAAAVGLSAAVWGVNRRLGTALLVCAGLYGFARIYVGVHYPLDIIAGALIGIVTALLVFKLRDLMYPILVWVIKFARLLCLA